MTRRLPLLAAAALIFVSACNDNRSPTAPPQLNPGQTAKSISDAGHSGNPNFFFLVPSLPPTSSLSSFKLGAFNPNLQPEILICQLSVASSSFPTATSACASSTADLKFPTDVHVVKTPATAFEISLQKTYTLPADGFYYAIWNTKGLNLTARAFYRLQVLIGTTQLGFIDVTPEPLGTGVLTLLNAVTHEVVPTLQDGTLPIIFRVQNGATCYPESSCTEVTVSNSGGTDQLNGKSGTYVKVMNADGVTEAAKEFFPNGFLDNTGFSQVVATIKRKDPIVGHNCADPTIPGNAGLLQFLGCYSFTTNPKVTFSTFATLTTCPELSHDNGGEETQLYGSEGDGTPASPFAPAHIPINCGAGKVFSIREPSNPLLRLAAHALEKVGRGVSHVFGPKPLYAWDLGVGGLDAGGTDVFWAMRPTLTVRANQAANAGSALTITGNVTTPHDLDPSNPGVGIPHDPASGVTVYFTVTTGGGILSAPSAMTDINGNASVSLTLPNVPGAVVTVAAQLHDAMGAPFGNPVSASVIANPLYSDNFEADIQRATTPFWNRNTLANITNAASPTYVTPADGDNSAGALPAPFGGSYSEWYGQVVSGNAVENGNYLGTQDPNDAHKSGGRSVGPNSGQFTTTAFSIPAGASPVNLTFDTWWEIESVNPSSYDLMRVSIMDVATGVESQLGQLNPKSDPGTTDVSLPFTSGGFNVAPVWQPVGYGTSPQIDLSAFGGKTVKLIFTFDTRDRNYNGFRGWIIDNVAVRVGEASPISILGSRARTGGLSLDVVATGGGVQLNPIATPVTRTP